MELDKWREILSIFLFQFDGTFNHLHLCMNHMQYYTFSKKRDKKIGTKRKKEKKTVFLHLIRKGIFLPFDKCIFHLSTIRSLSLWSKGIDLLAGFVNTAENFQIRDQFSIGKMVNVTVDCPFGIFSMIHIHQQQLKWKQRLVVIFSFVFRERLFLRFLIENYIHPQIESKNIFHIFFLFFLLPILSIIRLWFLPSRISQLIIFNC